MTKKHFIAFAAEIKSRLEGGSITKAEAFRIALIVMEVVYNTGPTNFDRGRFMSACGLLGL